MKSQKGGERKANEAETNSMKGLNEHESRWRLLVFGVPHFIGEEFRFMQFPIMDLFPVLVWI